jgi:hypothetical protein
MVFAEQPVSSWLVCSRLDPMSPRPALDSLSPGIRTPRASGSLHRMPRSLLATACFPSRRDGYPSTWYIEASLLGDITAISATAIRSEDLLTR